MKKNKIIYWSVTGIIAVMMVFSAYSYFANPKVAAGFQFLGFPEYFRVELGIAKLIGAFVLLIPAIPRRVKEWAYAGFALTFISAIIAHFIKNDFGGAMAPFLFLVVLVVSWIYLDKQKQESSFAFNVQR